MTSYDQKSKKIHQNPWYENCSHLWENYRFWDRFLGSKDVQKYIQPMFPYTEKYTESESDIQNNDLLYKRHQQCQNTFEMFEKQKQVFIL